MLLAIDVGNTNTVLGVFNKDKLEQSWRVKTDPRDTADELWLQYSALVDGFDITGVAICSTMHNLKHWCFNLQKVTGIKCISK